MSASGSRARVARERLLSWWRGDSASAALAWAASVLTLAAVLAWFFICSPYGAPAAPVYAEF